MLVIKFLLLTLSSINSLKNSNDTTILKAQITVDLRDSFFNCKRIDILKVFDTTNANRCKSIYSTSLIIQVNNDTINFVNRGTIVSYKINSKDSSIIVFESWKRDFSNSISVGNRQMFPYKLFIDHQKNRVKLVYDMSEIKRSQFIVFDGALIEKK